MTLGTIYSSSLFTGRAPDGNMLVLNYIGGATNRGIVDMSEEQLAEQVCASAGLRVQSAKDLLRLQLLHVEPAESGRYVCGRLP